MSEGHARLLNALALLGISALLAFAFVDQFLRSDLPCPLCLLQRVGFVLAGFGFALNVIYAPRPSHYGLVIISAIAGGAVAGRQVLLHIVPGSGTYGDALFGLHFYTWAFIAFVAIIAGSALLLIVDGKHQTKEPRQPAKEESFGRSPSSSRGMKRVVLVSVSIFGLLVGLNAISTFFQCSVGLCPDNPTHYELFR